MKAMEALHSRVSVPRLSDPAPDQTSLENIYKAAFRAADHALLKPWRFLLIQGDSRKKLGDLFVEAALKQDSDISFEKQANIRNKPLRAPLIIVCISSPREHPKVPVFEQYLSTAAACQNILVAAHAMGFGAMWRTGSMAYHETVLKGLGLSQHERIIGFIYVGTINGPRKVLNEANPDEFFKDW
tara:strand:- start:465 stop:1019 length:555 start_codon:yes stop_codon:yes gene_type:complete